MEKITTILFLFQLLVSCNGLNDKLIYSQKSESGLNGSVKKVTNYICPIEKYGKIPKDTTHFATRTITTYDSLGNILETNNFYRYIDRITEYSITYSGKGKNKTYIYKHIQGDSIKNTTYKEIWSDDYHFTVVPADTIEPSSLIVTSELNKDFRIIKSTYKTGNTIRTIDEFDYVVKNNKIQERMLKKTIKIGETDIIVYIVTVPQEFDQYENPILTYFYDNDNKKRIKDAGFTIYEYYNAVKTYPKTNK